MLELATAMGDSGVGATSEERVTSSSTCCS